MKEIHNDEFKFMPFLCASSMRQALLQPCPVTGKKATKDSSNQAPTAKIRLMDGAYG